MAGMRIISSQARPSTSLRFFQVQCGMDFLTMSEAGAS